MDLIAGVDEAGRGPLAGPVVAAAVILDPTKKIEGLKDSKALSVKKRGELEEEIIDKALCWKVSFVSKEEIDSLNILQATLKAMKLAVEGLEVRPSQIQIDGSNRIEVKIPIETIVGGDSKKENIMAASILAKQERDRYMLVLDKKYPQYGFKDHKGYGTKKHILSLKEFGPCEEHRVTFSPVKKIILKSN